MVDELTLSQVSGKYFGANMLVGLRVDLVSTLHTPQQGSASASGSLSIRRDGNGFEVQVDTRSGAVAGQHGAASAAGNPASTTGAETVRVNGIGQVSQIAGDGNAMANLTTISFEPSATTAATTHFNGLASSQASAGPLTARISFEDGGLQLGVAGPGARLGQQFNAGVDGQAGRISQVGQLAGHGLVGSNQLHLRLATEAMPVHMQHQLGIQQALAGLSALGR
ncbi:hypothetical protein [Lysobacter koreensis]|uniref:hypothetical protein n=1 Tax=Lysobacter koreensis TaxID=266122 RepID=UPI0036DCD101